MTLESAIGSPEKAIDNLRSMLGASAAWQAWTGTENATQAADRVHIDGLEPPEDDDVFTPETVAAYIPLCIITEEQTLSSHDAVGFESWSGTLAMEFISDAGLGTIAECNRRFNNLIFGVMADLFTARGSAGSLSHFSIGRRGGPTRGPIQDLPSKGDLLHGTIYLSWRGI